MATLGWPFDEAGLSGLKPGGSSEWLAGKAPTPLAEPGPPTAPFTPPTGPPVPGWQGAPTTTTDAGAGGVAPDYWRSLWANKGLSPGQRGYNLFAGYDDLGQLFFNQNPDQAWAHAWSQLGQNTSSPWWNWGRQQEGRYNDQYLAQAALPGGANMTFTDFINQHAPQFWNEFQNLPASQRGVTLQFQPAGRMG